MVGGGARLRRWGKVQKRKGKEAEGGTFPLLKTKTKEGIVKGSLFL